MKALRIENEYGRFQTWRLEAKRHMSDRTMASLAYNLVKSILDIRDRTNGETLMVSVVDTAPDDRDTVVFSSPEEMAGKAWEIVFPQESTTILEVGKQALSMVIVRTKPRGRDCKASAYDITPYASEQFLKPNMEWLYKRIAENAAGLSLSATVRGGTIHIEGRGELLEDYTCNWSKTRLTWIA